jgi:lipopolysaccharide export system protein LptC
MLRIITALLLGLGIILTLIALMDRPGTDSETTPGVPSEEQPDYWITDAVIDRFDGQGQAIGRLEADRLTHFPSDGRSELLQVEAIRRLSPTMNWWMRADSGLVSGDRSRVRLRGDARLERRELDAPTAILHSESLTFFPDRDRVETEAAVLLRRGPSRTTGVGMNADLAADQLQIQNEVRTVHVAPASR